MERGGGTEGMKREMGGNRSVGEGKGGRVAQNTTTQKHK